MIVRAKRYIRYLIPSSLFGTQRTKKIVNVNPPVETQRQDAPKTVITVYDYNEKEVREHKLESIEESFRFIENGCITWINPFGRRLLGSAMADTPLISGLVQDADNPGVDLGRLAH